MRADRIANRRDYRVTLKANALNAECRRCPRRHRLDHIDYRAFVNAILCDGAFTTPSK